MENSKKNRQNRRSLFLFFHPPIANDGSALGTDQIAGPVVLDQVRGGVVDAAQRHCCKIRDFKQIGRISPER